jgi:hypothetical protein
MFRRIACLSALAAAAVAPTAASAEAAAATAEPTPARLTLTWAWDGTEWHQRFRMGGAAPARGTFGERVLSERAAPDGRVDRRLRTVLHTGRGAIVVRWSSHEQYDPVEWTVHEWGTWRIVHATGAYAGLTGAGRFDQEGFVDGAFRRLAARGATRLAG